MSLLAELNESLTPLLSLETGVFSSTPPDRYLVITPMNDSYELYADDKPGNEVQAARLSLYDIGNYLSIKNLITRTLMNAGITITDCRYIGHENDTGYHHYTIDVAKNYDLEE